MGGRTQVPRGTREEPPAITPPVQEEWKRNRQVHVPGKEKRKRRPCTSRKEKESKKKDGNAGRKKGRKGAHNANERGRLDDTPEHKEKTRDRWCANLGEKKKVPNR